jgi:hypothetical protein
MQKGADGEDVLVWQLQGLTAGERVKGLAVRCVDEVGRPATAGVKGKVQVRCRIPGSSVYCPSAQGDCQHTGFGTLMT